MAKGLINYRREILCHVSNAKPGVRSVKSVPAVAVGPAPVIERGIPRSGDVSILDGRKACEERKLFIKTVLRQNVDKKGSHSCAYRF